MSNFDDGETIGERCARLGLSVADFGAFPGGRVRNVGGRGQLPPPWKWRHALAEWLAVSDRYRVSVVTAICPCPERQDDFAPFFYKVEDARLQGAASCLVLSSALSVVLLRMHGILADEVGDQAGDLFAFLHGLPGNAREALVGYEGARRIGAHCWTEPVWLDGYKPGVSDRASWKWSLDDFQEWAEFLRTTEFA